MLWITVALVLAVATALFVLDMRGLLKGGGGDEPQGSPRRMRGRAALLVAATGLGLVLLATLAYQTMPSASPTDAFCRAYPQLCRYKFSKNLVA